MSFDAMFRRVQKVKEQKQLDAKEKQRMDAVKLPPPIVTDLLEQLGRPNAMGRRSIQLRPHIQTNYRSERKGSERGPRNVSPRSLICDVRRFRRKPQGK